MPDVFWGSLYIQPVPTFNNLSPSKLKVLLEYIYENLTNGFIQHPAIILKPMVQPNA